jgi:hypothetical protein
VRRIIAGSVLVFVSVALLSGCASGSSARRRKSTALATATALPETEFQAAARKLGCTDDGFVRKGTRLIPQKYNVWCWAASAQMVEFFLSGNVLQCQIANDGCVLKQQTCSGDACCTLPADCCQTPEKCLVTGWPPFERRKIEFKRVPVPLSAGQLVKEICEKRPVVFSWKYKDDGGHIMVAVGFDTVDGQDVVIVNDPAPVNAGARYPMLFTTYQTGDFEHWDDFFELKKKP